MRSLSNKISSRLSAVADRLDRAALALEPSPGEPWEAGAGRVGLVASRVAALIVVVLFAALMWSEVGHGR